MDRSDSTTLAHAAWRGTLLCGTSCLLAVTLGALAACTAATSSPPGGGSGDDAGPGGTTDPGTDGSPGSRDAGTDAAASGTDAGADGGSTDPGNDAGVAADAGPATTCFEALQSAEGTACTFDGACGGGDLCCGFSVSCSEGYVTDRFADERCDEAARPTGCTGTALSLEGTTPLGPVELPYVHASFSYTPSVDVALVFSTEEEFAYCGGDRLGFWLSSNNAGSWSYAGTHETIGQLVVDGAIARAPVTVEITSEDSAYPGKLVGTLTVHAPGWELSGEFTADGCAETDRSGP